MSTRAILLVGVGLFLLLASTIGASAASSHTPPGISLPGSAAPGTPAASKSTPIGLSVHPYASFSLGDSGRSPAALSLNWSASSIFGLSGYTVQISTSGASGPWSPDGTTSAQVTSLGLNGLSPGGIYWWQVIATGFLGATQTSSVLQVQQPTLAYLSAPTNTTTSVSLQWTNNATYGGSVGFVNYTLFESSNGSAPAAIGNLSPASTLTDTIMGLTAGTGYSFYVKTADCYAGCGAGGAALSDTQSNTVTVGTPQPLSVTLSAQHPTVDTGQPDLFACTATGGSSPYSYAWNPGTGTFTAGSHSESFSFGTPGFVLVSCRVTDTHSLTSTSTDNVTVASYPTVSVMSNRTGADAHEPISLGCAPSNGSGTIAVAWDFGDGSGSPIANVSHPYAAAGQYSARCTVTDRVGGTAAASLTLNVTPVLGAAIGPESAAAAPGTNLTFTGAGVNGSGTYTGYRWDLGDGTRTHGKVVFHVYPTAGDYTVSLRVNDSYGTVATSQLLLSISPLSVSVGTIPTSVSSGSTVTFSASTSGGAGAPYNYSWLFGDGTIGYGASVGHRFTGSGDRWPVLTVRDRLGAASVSALPELAVVSPSAPFAWLTPLVGLLLAALIAFVVGLIVLVVRRRSDAEKASAEGLGRWVPPVGPARMVRGTRICPSCGAANLSLRHTCHACGRDLPRRSAK